MKESAKTSLDTYLSPETLDHFNRKFLFAYYWFHRKLNNCLTNQQLTLWSRFLFKNILVPYLFNNFPTFYASRSVTWPTAFTATWLLIRILPYANPVYVQPHYFLKLTLIDCFHSRLLLASCFFPLFFFADILYTFLFCFRTIRQDLGATQLSAQWVQELKRPGSEAGLSRPSSAEFKNKWNSTSNFPVCFHGVYKNNLTLTPVHATCPAHIFLF
jgi:hypothetical protein